MTDDTLDITDDEIVAGRMVSRSKLLHNGSLGKGHVILVGRYNLVGILLGRTFNHGEEAAGHLLSVDDKGAAEDLMAAVLAIDLREAENFAVRQRTSQLALYVMQIFDFLGRKRQSLLFVVSFKV